LAVRLGFFLAALFSTRAVFAADDNRLRVDVVVNLTDEGTKVPRPTPDKPAYYLPFTAGYIESGAVLAGEKPPPPAPEVEHLLAKALAEQGYLVMNKKNHPSLILIFWWGYMAPILDNPYGDMANGSAGKISGGSITMTGVGISAGEAYEGPLYGGSLPYNGAHPSSAEFMGSGAILPTGAFTVAPNSHDMFLLVGGDRFEEQIGQWDAFGVHDSLHEAAHHPRYFLMVSALDFQSATQRKPILLWCARVSTELSGHTLDGVLPALIETGAKKFGMEADRAKFTTVPVVPMGHVVVGTPVLKDSSPDKPASQ
jgi:hypothetical protein